MNLISHCPHHAEHAEFRILTVNAKGAPDRFCQMLLHFNFYISASKGIMSDDTHDRRGGGCALQSTQIL